MHILLENVEVYVNHSFVKYSLAIRDGKIESIGACSADDQEWDKVYDFQGKRVVPGFIDLHTHGAVGVDVNAATAEDLEKICTFFASQGTTSWLESVLTDTKEQTLWCIGEHKKWRAMEHNGANLLGIHLEGPFLSVEYKGAMPEHLLFKEPNLPLLKEYQQEAGGNIRYITISPELEGMASFIPQIKDLGIVVAIGHSGADYATARDAIAHGATAATHTSNAMRLLHQHEPAIWGAVLEDDDVYCEMICDGRHLHPGTVRLIIKAKGLDRVIAVTDSIMAAGLPDGDYKLGVNDVVVKDGDARLKSNDVRAGSTLTSIVALKNLMSFTGRPMEEVLPLMTENPAKLIGCFDHKGSIEVGKDADLVVLDDACNICGVFVGGKMVVVNQQVKQ